ncbi:receptor-like protein EIX2 [Silene latifolia]|uniref:receptor-like protein EIX2 n=1 Tax=Silene latifolia TaxID=37657 RepID=UPI003D773DF4
MTEETVGEMEKKVAYVTAGVWAGGEEVFHASLCVHGKQLKSLGFIRCKKHEHEALQKFKQSFTNDPMNRLSSWVGQDCCQWDGVTCDNVTHHVVKLNLRSQMPYNYDNDDMGDDLTCGWFDPQVSMVSPRLSSALIELELLTHLDLSGNNFFGSRIPEFIGSLRHLRYLNLSSANFSGLLPPQLGNLTNLVHLDLNVNICDDPSRYAKGLGWTSSLLKLQSLDLSYYNLSRAHDTFKVLNTLPSLSALSLSECELDNSHLSESLRGNTSYSFFPTLQHLDLSSNAFEGPVPSVFENMVSLRSLFLFYNNFNGSVPLWLRAMKRLEVLDLSSNEFSYVEGGIMGIMGNPCNFKHLDLSNNIISQGDIIESLVMWCGAFELKYLDLSGNKMNGSLPSLLGQFTNLNNLDLSYNEFKGQIPSSFVKLSYLKYLDLSYNQLSGLIPDFIGHLIHIEHLDISLNSLQGTVFGIGNLSKLSYLDMNFNTLNLSLDSSFNWRPSFQLRVFRAHSCVINTVFPQWLKNQTRIEELDLSYTGISEELPRWLWNLSSLLDLSLSGNGHTGSLPQYKACDLETLNLHDNLLNGTIPYWLHNSKNAEIIDLSSNMLTGAIFDGNNASSLFNIGFYLFMLDLSDNMLSGEIQFGMQSGDIRLDNHAPILEILSLRGNHFNGPIHSQLCDFGSLFVLDLAWNHLT